MMQYSVLIPQRNGGEEVALQIPRLRDVMRALGTYEIICIDDGSTGPTLQMLESLAGQYPELRVLRSPAPGGVGAAISAGISASVGDMVVACEAGRQYPPEEIPSLVAHLNRCDLVFGHRRVGGIAKFAQRILRLPRWLLLGLEVRDPDCLFWAARREAVEGIQLYRGMCRYLSSLVSMRGFRVNEAYVRHCPSSVGYRDGRANPADLLGVWWLRRRWNIPAFEELTPADARPQLKLVAASSDQDLRKRA